MGDMGDYWHDVRPAMVKESQQRRASNRERSAALLQSNGIPFESKNGGAHVVVNGGKAVIDFWPGTGLWQERGSIATPGFIATGRGVRSLVKRATGRNIVTTPGD